MTATALTMGTPPDWGRYLGDPTITSAILDRLAMHAIRVNIDGPSYRQHIAKERARERGEAEQEVDEVTS